LTLKDNIENKLVTANNWNVIYTSDGFAVEWFAHVARSYRKFA